MPRACVPQQKPPQSEAFALPQRVAPLTGARESTCAAIKTQGNQKIKILKIYDSKLKLQQHWASQVAQW